MGVSFARTGFFIVFGQDLHDLQDMRFIIV